MCHDGAAPPGLLERIEVELDLGLWIERLDILVVVRSGAFEQVSEAHGHIVHRSGGEGIPRCRTLAGDA